MLACYLSRQVKVRERRLLDKCFDVLFNRKVHKQMRARQRREADELRVHLLKKIHFDHLDEFKVSKCKELESIRKVEVYLAKKRR